MKAPAVALVSLAAVLLVALGASALFGGSRAGVSWEPEPGTSWQWQLTGSGVDLSYGVDAYDVDGFSTSAQTVKRIHQEGAKAICYLSVGSREDWRPDADHFPEAVVGERYEGWSGERWLDIRQIRKFAPIMEDRLDMCAAKGFDAVEPDNVDGYANDTGFPLTYEDQLRYNIWLAREAHERGLSVALKNAGEQARDLEPHYDFAITEDCFEQGWCADMRPFVDAGKAVLAAEYADTGITPRQFCPEAQRLGFDAIYKKRALGPWRRGC